MIAEILFVIFMILFFVGICICGFIGRLFKKLERNAAEKDAMRRNIRALERELVFYKNLLAGRDDELAKTEV